MQTCRSFLTLAAVMLAANAAHGAPVTFNTALPVGGGEFVARGLFILSESGQDRSGTDREHRAVTSIAVIGYGLNHKLALFGVLPYVDKELDMTLMVSRVNRAASGLGDMSVFMRYTVVQRDRPGSTLRVAPFLGLKAPTGYSARLDAIGSLPPSVLPGSGAWDVFGGVTVTYQTFAFQTDAQLSYRIKNESGGFDPGDEFRLDGSLQYRLWPHQLGAGVPNFLYGILESNVVYRDRNRVNGGRDVNSGGTTVYLSPGLQWVTRRWILEGVIQLPIAQNLHGQALENDYILRTGFRFNF